MYKNGKPNYNEIVFSNKDIENIIALYLSGESSVSIGKKYNTTHKPILKILHKNNIVIDSSLSHRKYALNEEFFDQINTQEKAYILGLLYSDGSNNPDKSTIAISLQEEDKEILEQIRKIINSEKPLEYIDNSNKHDFGYSYKNQYRLLMFSKHMCESLSSLGVVKNKSLIISFPNFLSDSLLPHFIRGVFDGDGSIYQAYRNENNLPIVVTITATNDFCLKLKSIVQDTLSINGGVYEASCHNGITKVFSLSGRNVCKVFLDWIYKDATIYMQRKHDRYVKYYDINNSLTN